MKRKHFFLQGKTYGLLAIAGLMSFASCAEGVDEESFDAGVRNTQLESPVIDKDCFSTITGTDGSESLKLAWDVVMGAGGYHCVIDIVDDPANPVNVVDTILDRPSLTFEKLEDTNYSVSVLTLGNEKLNNKGATEPTVYAHSTFLPATLVEGTDIAEFINAYIAANQETLEADRKASHQHEIAFELEAGKEYTMNAPLDLGLYTTTIRTNSKNNNARVIVGEGGCLTTQAGLKVKFVNFDCTNIKKEGLIYLSDSPSEEIKDANLAYKGGSSTYKQLGAAKNSYIIEDPIVFQNCMVKNLKNGWVFSKKAYGIMDLRVVESIIQWNNTGKYGLVYMQSGNTCIKDLTISKSTIYNTVTGSFFFLALNNQNRPKVFGSAGNGAKTRFEYSTLYLPGNGKNVGDRLKSEGDLINKHRTELESCIFYDFKQLSRLQDVKAQYTINNTIFRQGSTDSQDFDAEYLASGSAPVDPGFTPQGELDLTQKNGGINFTPTGVALTNQRGDPRWLE